MLIAGVSFYPATRMHSAGMPWQDRPSVRQSHAGIVSKRLYISSKIFHLRVAPPFYLFCTKPDSNIPTGTP